MADSEADRGGEADEADPEGSMHNLVAQLAPYDESLAAAVGSLLERVEDQADTLDEQTDQIEELEQRLKRERANFQNYKKRTKEREEQLKERATADLVERLLDVRDNLTRALEQDDNADIRDGVEATLASFDRILEGESVSAIEPEPGDEVDPERHEVVMREDEGDQPGGAIERVYRPGYTQADRVLRPAQVTVSAEEEAATDDAE